MRKSRWLKNGIYGLAWLFILFAGIRIVVGGFSGVESAWWKSFTRSVTGAVFQTAAPASAYIMEEKRPDTLAQYLLRLVRGVAPVWEYASKSGMQPDSMQDPFYVERQDFATEKENPGSTGTDQPQEPGTQNTAQDVPPDVPGQDMVQDGTAVPSQDVFSPNVTGTVYPLAKLCDYDFLVRNFYVISQITTLTSSELDAKELLEKDLTIEKDGDNPQILIYHTHYSEDFVDSRPGVEEDTIVGVGEYLATVLREQYGYSVYHDTTPYDMVEGMIDRSSAYDYAADGVGAILEQYPSIEVVIDLHRDGVNEGVHLLTEVNGKPTAQLMFVNGISKTTLQGDIPYLYNPYIKDNLAFSLKLQLEAEAYYPGLCRRILINAYRYNMHLRPRSILVEAGAQTNTIEEVKNAMEPLAVMLHKTLSGGENE